MNDIPAHIRDFDVCWSACALEHLGSLEHGLRFIERSLDTLRPGGIAIHTTEFNLDSNAETFEHADLCFFRKQDIEKLWQRLSAAGHIVSPLNFHPGFGTMDRYIDLPPYSLPHLKIQVLGTTTTSIGLMVQKRL
jgi:SAM-dependent methyltransferase